jgi:hypothetical protein
MTNIPPNSQPPPPRREHRPNPRAAPDRERWQDRLTVEGRYRLADLEAAREAGAPAPVPPPVATPGYETMSYEQKRAAQDAASGGR